MHYIMYWHNRQNVYSGPRHNIAKRVLLCESLQKCKHLLWVPVIVAIIEFSAMLLLTLLTSKWFSG